MDYTRWRGREKGVSVLAAILNAAGKRTPRFLRGPFRLLFSYGLNMFSDLYQRRKKKKKKKSPISFIPPFVVKRHNSSILISTRPKSIGEKENVVVIILFLYNRKHHQLANSLSLSFCNTLCVWTSFCLLLLLPLPAFIIIFILLWSSFYEPPMRYKRMWDYHSRLLLVFTTPLRSNQLSPTVIPIYHELKSNRIKF